ncbi:vacuolar transporter chaperone [Actinomortierella ambigua]|nr:vacuolar transporter chaperone [Actinomortierella ambigua]
MKFGSHLKSQRPSQWKFYFVDYDGLKALLKSKSLGRIFTEQDEEHFTNQLVQELVKVASFQSIKLNEIRLRTEHCEDTIRQDQHGDSSALPQTYPTKKTSEKLTLASFVVTEAEINKITEDIQDLARFQRLNYTAFLKILKKHDKHTGFELRQKFITRHLSEHPFHKQSLEPIVKRLSSLYSIVRTGAASPTVSKAHSIVSSDYENDHDADQFVSKKTSFWVHPDNIMDLKMLILKYLPLVVYEPTPALNSSHRSTSQLCDRLSSESPVSTVYLDNADLDLFMSHVEHQDREETIRLRWYGAEQKQIWVERQQQHHQRSTSGSLLPTTVTAASPSTATTASSSSQSSTLGGRGEDNTTSSVGDGGDDALGPNTVFKHRFPIKAKHVPSLLRGEANVDKIVNQLRLQTHKSESEVQAFKDKTRAVQAQIQKRGLVPVVQTFFNRTAFQVPGDYRVRITLDTEVAMVREFNDHRCGCLKRGEACPHWRRTDIQAADYPFPFVKKDDLTLFPYAIMSIRTLTDDPHEDVPAWVDRIAQSHLVEMVPNFTKDQHAIATLYEYQAGLLPFWLSDMDRDIRKPARLSGSSPNTRSQDSNSNAGSISNSNDTFHSLQSATNSLASISDGSLASALTKGVLGSAIANPQDSRRGKKNKERQGILDKNLFVGPQQQQPGVTFQETLDEIVIVQRAAPTADAASEQPLPITANKLPSTSTPVTSPTTTTTAPRPIVGCLKKHPSTSSLRSDRSNTSSQGSIDYGSCTSREQSPQQRRRRRRVTFKSKTRILWERAQAHLPHWVVNNALTNKLHQFAQERRERQEQHLWEQEQQQIQQQQAFHAAYDIDDHDSTTTITYTRLQQQQQRRLQQQARRQAWFWNGLTTTNMALLFVGLLVALLNFGDGIGEEVASLYLIVSCLGMGSTVWVYLVQREGWDKVSADDEDEFEQMRYNHDRYPTASSNNAAAMLDEDDEEEQQFMERQGLLPQYQQHAAYAKKSARYQAHRNQHRMRFLTRAATVATFLSLLAVVSLNLMIRVNYEEDENSM